MREFSEIEKDILKKTYEHYQNCIELYANIKLDAVFYDLVAEDARNLKVALRMNHENKKVEIYSLGYKEGRIFLARTMLRIKIFEYLIHNGLIYSLYDLKDYQEPWLCDPHSIIDREEKKSVSLLPSVEQKLFNFFGYCFIMTEELVLYIKKGFKTKEDIKHRWTMRAAWLSIAVAFGLGVAAFFDKPKYDPIINTIDKNNDQLLNRLDSLNILLGRLTIQNQQQSLADTTDSLPQSLSDKVDTIDQSLPDSIKTK